MQISTATHPYVPAVYSSTSRRPLPIEEEGKDAGLVENSPARTRIIQLPGERYSDRQAQRPPDTVYQQQIALATAATVARAFSAGATVDWPPRVVRENNGIDENLSLRAQRAISAYEGTASMARRLEVSMVLGIDTYA